MSAHVHASNVGGEGCVHGRRAIRAHDMLCERVICCIVNDSTTDTKYVVSQGTFLPSKARAGGTRSNNFLWMRMRALLLGPLLPQ